MGRGGAPQWMRSAWERWRLAGELRPLRQSNLPAGRRRSQVRGRPRQLGFKSLRQAQRAGLGDAIGQLGRDHIPVNARRRRIVVEFRRNDGLLSRVEDLAEQYGLKLAACFRYFLVLGKRAIARQAFGRDIRCVDRFWQRSNEHISGGPVRPARRRPVSWLQKWPSYRAE